MRKAYFVIPTVLATMFTASISRGAPVEVMCFGQPTTIVGTPRDDRLTGTAGNDVIAGLGGNDRIDGLGGDDLICGNDNPNWTDGNEGQEVLIGGPGDDRLSGGWGVEYIYGGEGNDLIRGGRGSEKVDYLDNTQSGLLYGGPGEDVIRGGPGDDDLWGGGGWQTVSDGGDHLYGGTGSDLLADNAYDEYYAFQTADDANDSLFGGPGGDALFTSGGDDYQYGGHGDDALGRTEVPGRWNDIDLDGVEDIGDDTYDGGPGRDSVTAARASTTPVLFDLSAGRASSDSLGEDTLLNLEIVIGSSHDDTIIGDDGPNWLYGGHNGYRLGRRLPMGNDILIGRGGDDFLDGLDDTVGSDHFDSVDGGEGNDSCPTDADDELISCEI